MQPRKKKTTTKKNNTQTKISQNSFPKVITSLDKKKRGKVPTFIQSKETIFKTPTTVQIHPSERSGLLFFDNKFQIFNITEDLKILFPEGSKPVEIIQKKKSSLGDIISPIAFFTKGKQDLLYLIFSKRIGYDYDDFDSDSSYERYMQIGNPNGRPGPRYYRKFSVKYDEENPCFIKDITIIEDEVRKEEEEEEEKKPLKFTSKKKKFIPREFEEIDYEMWGNFNEVSLRNSKRFYYLLEKEIENGKGRVEYYSFQEAKFINGNLVSRSIGKLPIDRDEYCQKIDKEIPFFIKKQHFHLTKSIYGLYSNLFHIFDIKNRKMLKRVDIVLPNIKTLCCNWLTKDNPREGNFDGMIPFESREKNYGEKEKFFLAIYNIYNGQFRKSEIFEEPDSEFKNEQYLINYNKDSMIFRNGDKDFKLTIPDENDNEIDPEFKSNYPKVIGNLKSEIIDVPCFDKKNSAFLKNSKMIIGINYILGSLQVINNDINNSEEFLKVMNNQPFLDQADFNKMTTYSNFHIIQSDRDIFYLMNKNFQFIDSNSTFCLKSGSFLTKYFDNYIAIMNRSEGNVEFLKFDEKSIRNLETKIQFDEDGNQVDILEACKLNDKNLLSLIYSVESEEGKIISLSLIDMNKLEIVSNVKLDFWNEKDKNLMSKRRLFYSKKKNEISIIFAKNHLKTGVKKMKRWVDVEESVIKIFRFSLKEEEGKFKLEFSNSESKKFKEVAIACYEQIDDKLLILNALDKILLIYKENEGKLQKISSIPFDGILKLKTKLGMNTVKGYMDRFLIIRNFDGLVILEFKTMKVLDEFSTLNSMFLSLAHDQGGVWIFYCSKKDMKIVKRKVIA